MTGLILLGELFILFFFSRKLTQNLYVFVYLLSRSRAFAISVVTLLLFPGTVIHELAHLFTAEILGVRTGKLVLAPEAIRGDEIQAGSVAIAQTGPFRKAVIGLAPLVWGLVAIGALSYFLLNPPTNLPSQISPIYWQTAIFYLLFSISNAMFPSSLDLAGTPATFITITLLLVGAYATGIRLSLNGQSLELIRTVFFSLAQSTGLVLAVNLSLLFIVQVLIVLSAKMLGKTVKF